MPIPITSPSGAVQSLFIYCAGFSDRKILGIAEGCATMRIEKTDTRAQKWELLKEATGEDATSKALDCAADYYFRMRGDTAAVLSETASKKGRRRLRPSRR